MEELIVVNEETMTVSARDLHEKLNISTRFNDWFPRVCEYGFVLDADYFYSTLSKTSEHGGRPSIDYDLTIDMAKQICMIQKTEEGMRIRRYFLDLEKAWNTPEQILARALKIADQTIANLRPKAEYFDALVDRNLLTNFRDTAKELHIKQKVFITQLANMGYIYRDSHGNIRPYADKNNGLFELKEFANGDFAGVQTLVTPRGRETFRLLLEDKVEKGD